MERCAALESASHRLEGEQLPHTPTTHQNGTPTGNRTLLAGLEDLRPRPEVGVWSYVLESNQLRRFCRPLHGRPDHVAKVAVGERVGLPRQLRSLVFKTSSVASYRIDLP